MSRRRTTIGVLVVAVLLAACGNDDAATGSVPVAMSSSEPSATTVADDDREPSTSGTVVDDPAPPDSPGPSDSSETDGDPTLVATEVDATDEVLAVLGEPGTAATASELAEAVADAFASAGDPAAVERVDQGEPSVALVTVLVPGDDAIDGVRYRVQMTEGQPGVWRVTAATRAYVCSRATDGELCV